MRIFYILAFLTSWLIVDAMDVLVVDSENCEPVVAATVFSQSGNIIGMTDADGCIKGIADREFPLTVRSLGYVTAECQPGTDTVRMIHDTYELGEVLVTPTDRPILHMICYIREYTSSATPSDTVQYLAEHMGDFYLPRGKVKKFKGKSRPRLLKSRLYERNASSDGLDSVSRPQYYRDDISWIDLVSIPTEILNETDAVKSGERNDSIMGKHGLKTVITKEDNAYICRMDYLADSKNHKMSPFIFKLLGFSMDFTEMVGQWAYRPSESGTYEPADLLYGTFAMSVTGRGKWIKKAFETKDPVEMKGYFEIYPMEMEYLTVDEANDQLRDNPPKVKFERSQAAAPLPPALRSLMERVEALQ